VKVQAPEFLTYLIRAATGAREGIDVAALQAGSSAAPHSESPDQSKGDEEPLTSGERATPTVSDLDPGLIGVLAEKVLLAWLRNRYQLLFPFAVNLRQLDQRQAEILVHAMIAAAQADGSFDKREQERVEGTLSLVSASDSERHYLAEATKRPKPLNEILGEVHDVQTGALIYAASLMALDERKPVNRYYLRYLAARLQLSEELAGSLEQRYRSSS